MTRNILLLLAAGALGLVGCSNPEAPEKCRELRNAYCEKAGDECMTSTEAQCKDAFNEETDCDEAIWIEPEYEDCREDIDDLDECPMALPEDCSGVIITEATPWYLDDDEEDDE